MSNNVTKDELKIALREHTDEIVGVMQSFMHQVDERMSLSEYKQTAFEKKVNERFDNLDQKFDNLLSTIDGFVARIDKYETELAARDNQIEKLIAWARKVSEKTGIPLENL